MAIIRNRVDFQLRSTAEERQVIDVRETGGSEASQLVITLEGGGSVTVEGSDTESFDSVTWTTTVTVPADGEYRERMPLDAARFIRLASGAPTGAILWARY